MKLNGEDTSNNVVGETGKSTKTLHKKEKKAKVTGVARDKAKASTIIGTITAIVTILMVLVALVYCAINIAGWWNIRSTEKEITEEFSAEILESKVYVDIEVITATVNGYENGVIYTDYGDIKGSEPKTSVVMAYYAIDGSLNLLGDIYSDPLGVEYVTGSFNPPAGAIVVKSAADKGEYLDYVNMANELAKLKSDKATDMKVLIASIIIAIVSAVIFILSRAGLFDKLDNLEIDKKKQKEEVVNTEESGVSASSDIPDSIIEEAVNDIVDKQDIKKPPVKTDVDPGE